MHRTVIAPLNGLTSLKFFERSPTESDDGRLVDIGKVDYSKPIFVIFNPMAGRNPEQKAARIKEGLKENFIKYEFY